MIQQWRVAFGAPDLLFVYVLVAVGHTAAMREAQFQGAGALALHPQRTSARTGVGEKGYECECDGECEWC